MKRYVAYFEVPVHHRFGEQPLYVRLRLDSVHLFQHLTIMGPALGNDFFFYFFFYFLYGHGYIFSFMVGLGCPVYRVH